MKIVIMMAIQNKNGCLENTLFSIKQQVSDITPHLCILDDASDEDPLPIIQKYFSAEQVTFFKNTEPVGFEKIRKQMLGKLKEKADYIIWQSCDVIWNHPQLLNTLLSQAAKDKKDHIYVPRILNFRVPEDSYKQGDNFYPYLKRLSEDKSLYGEPKKSSYSYLGLIKADIFRHAVEARTFGSDGVCDLTLSHIFPSLGVKFAEIKSMTAIHQTHSAAIYECSSINECTHPCPIRRRMIAKGMKFPFDIGYYNPSTRRWKDHPSYHK